MVGERTLYSVLGVAPDAPTEVVKAAYRALAKQYHPDGAGAGSDEATEKFIELQEAYSIISDVERRAEYDRITFGELSPEVPIDEVPEAEIRPDEVWELKAREHPEIIEIHDILAKYSPALANRFMLAVLDGECDADPASYALNLDIAYFKKYFGDKPELQDLARRLLRAGLRPAAKSLNKAIQDGRFDNPVKAQRLVSVFERILGQQNAEVQPYEVADGNVFDEEVINHDEPQMSRFGSGGVIAAITIFLMISIGLIYSSAHYSSEPERTEIEEVAPTDQISGDLAEVESFELCNGALNSSKDWWEPSSIFAVEADNRGLSVDDCRKILGLPAISKPTDVDLEKTGQKQIYDRIVGEVEVSGAIGEPIESGELQSELFTKTTKALTLDTQEVANNKTNAASNGNAGEFAKPKRRVALVIGNSNYRRIPWLENPSRDARAMAESLAGVGFEVTLVLDATKRDLRIALLEFSQTLADDTDVALLYYSGHAVQISENNYLLPVDVSNQDGDEIAFSSLSISEVIQVMVSQRVPNKILILDACRNNPLSDAGDRGLATVKAGMGTFIAYSTQPGNVAEDGIKGQNSPYTAAVVAELKSPSRPIEETFKQVRVAVAKATKGRQVPWESSSLVEKFTFSIGDGMARGGIKDFVNVSDSTPQLPNEAIRYKMSMEENCLARAIYFESKSGDVPDQESLIGKIFDRVKGPDYPKSICGVVYRNSSNLNSCDFAFACNGVPDDVTDASTWASSLRFARQAISRDPQIRAILNGKSNADIILDNAYSNGDDGELSIKAEDALPVILANPPSQPTPIVVPPPPLPIPGSDQQGYYAPKPRPKPIEVLMMAAVNMQIEPASAPPPDPTKRVSPLAGNVQGYVIVPERLAESASLESNAAIKTNLTGEMEGRSADVVPTIRTITASAQGDDLFWWPSELVFDSSKAVQRDGERQRSNNHGRDGTGTLPSLGDANVSEIPQSDLILPVPYRAQTLASGKGDILVVKPQLGQAAQ